MSNSNMGMIEIIDSEIDQDLYFSTVMISVNDETFTLRFAIKEEDFYHVKKIVTYRPFENTGDCAYKYFFPGSYIKNDPVIELTQIAVRIEQQTNIKEVYFWVSDTFVGNLLWFYDLKEKGVLKSLVNFN